MCALGIGRGRQGPWDFYGTIGEDFLQRGVLKKHLYEIKAMERMSES